MKAISNIIVLALLMSCNTPAADSTKKATPQQESKASSPINCYQYASQADTITLKLIHIGESITGTLVYKLKEKDSNKGTIRGAMRGDLLVAMYTFMSEGIQSSRQVAFKLAGDSFVEGYGESTGGNGPVTFKNVDALTFSTSVKLAPIACQ